MAAPTSSNFQFLSAHDTLLVALGAQAERYFVEDPNTSLMKLRQFGERLAQRAAAHLGIRWDNLRQFELIEKLASPPYNALSAEVRSMLHELRKGGNDAVHDFTASHEEALQLLKLARQLAIWFHGTFGKVSGFNPGPFIPPPDPAQENRALATELERLRGALNAAQLDAETARSAAEAEARRRLDAEERARRDAEDCAVWQQLAEEAEKRLVEELNTLQTQAAAQPPEALKLLAAASYQAGEKLELDEAETRRLIDAQLREAGWEVDSERLTHESGARPVAGRNLAISEWPTGNGRADYVLFAGLQAVAVVEAKRWRTDVSGALPQARRYAESFAPTGDATLPGGPWGTSQLPFLFATNGRPYLKQLETKSGIWFHDVRRPANLPRALPGWYSPQGLMDLLKQDIEAAEKQLREQPVDLPSLRLRDYQKSAIQAIEDALATGRRACLVAMATGTGKTRTCLGLVYRLVKSNRFRRILFVVDRSALGDQASDTFKTELIDGHQTFATIYGLKEMKDISPDETTRLHVATVQGLLKRVLSPSEGEPPPAVSQYDCIVVDECHRGYTLDREMSDGELTFRDQDDYLSKYRRVLEYFDAVKIGLTATPALHTQEIFGSPVFQYGYRQAVIDGWLVDHEPPIRISTERSEAGITFKAGEEVPTLVTGTQLELFRLPDEINFEVEDFNRSVITEPFNRVVAGVVAQYVDPRLEGKTLVFCVNEQHANLMVKVLQEALAARYGEVDSNAVMKITGKTDRVDEQIRRYKNERQPSIAVTVDLLTTGIDVPSICNLVFVRRVKSRILYEQMLGRATRLYDFKTEGTVKESFRIFDAVDLYETLQPYSAMKPVVVQPHIPFAQLAQELQGQADDAWKRVVLDQLLAKLQRKKKALRERHAELFEAAAGAPVDEVLETLKAASPREAAEWFTAHSQVAELLDRTTGNGDQSRVYISEHADALKSLTRGYGEGRERPEDYLEGFGRFVKENANKLPALLVVTQRPRELTRDALKELKLALDTAGYTEPQLQSAWREVKNEDIAATIIGFVRQQALGEPLVPYAERVERAMKKVLASRQWEPPQKQWLRRIGQQLTANVVLDRQIFDSAPAFKDHGGWAALDKVMEGKLEQVLGELADNVWSPAA
ncbi:type I restriction-modification system endonuclease [Archangium lipolyticum]|uniref:type I restriction-modification system endonuclease n=1 Tax=Archangium lipolyticum TaxID=2970465 RepID=UPI002149A6F5|nr:type I restriction-modification system endonuclease [Archangium lipolyticum]